MDTFAKAVFDNDEAAKSFYNVARRRLLEVYNWAEVSQLPSSTFILTDRSGTAVQRTVEEGDYFKIDIPGPGPSTGDSYDWVQVEKIDEESDLANQAVSIRVRPAANPLKPDTDTAHFFEDTATSTFQVIRIRNEVYAEVHGRNEQPNTSTGKISDNIRNTLVGLGAKLGMAYPQWKGLVEGLVKTEKS